MTTAAYRRNQPVRILSFAGPTLERDWSETGTVQRRETIGTDPDWYSVRFTTGGALMVHASRLMPSNAGA